MRMTDTLRQLNGDWPTRPGYEQYTKALEILSSVAPGEWALLFDSHQIGTRVAGKSSCSFFYKSVSTMPDALSLLTDIHETFPNVNVELQVLPDGDFDFGDGYGSYRRAAWEQSYLPAHGRCYAILVDTQNLLRYA